MNKAEKEIRNREIRSFVCSGHTYPEASKKYGVCLETIRKICKGCREGYINQFVSGDFDQLENCKRYISKANPYMEYVSGTVSTKGHVTLRCTKCGNELTRSMETIRKGTLRCYYCYSTEIENRHRIAEEEKRKRKEERHAIALANKPIVIVRAKAKQLEATRQRQEARRHDCPICGESTTRPKYCSKKCGVIANTRKNNSVHEARRRTKLKTVVVDKGITLKKLYDRDGGRCWICGMVCDYADKTYTDKTMIAGNMYPSIDHVVALKYGGTHSWENVRLAHRICNSLRYWTPPG